MITVKELKEYLSKFPDDAVVGCIYQLHSDYEPMELSDITFYGKVERDRDDQKWYAPDRYILRNGKIMEYNARTFPPGEIPQFIDLLIFPGN